MADLILIPYRDYGCNRDTMHSVVFKDVRENEKGKKGIQVRKIRRVAQKEARWKLKCNLKAAVHVLWSLPSPKKKFNMEIKKQST